MDIRRLLMIKDVVYATVGEVPLKLDIFLPSKPEAQKPADGAPPRRSSVLRRSPVPAKAPTTAIVWALTAITTRRAPI